MVQVFEDPGIGVDVEASDVDLFVATPQLLLPVRVDVPLFLAPVFVVPVKHLRQHVMCKP